MKRRKFCDYATLSVACFGQVIGSDFASAVYSKSSAKLIRKWVVLYWMPYDNDLSVAGEPIIKMLIDGTKESEVAVVVQSDYLGEIGMRRRQITNGAVSRINVRLGEDSSDVSAFSAYLDWAYQKFEAEHWVIAVVGHGGKINEVSPDDHAATRKIRTWMQVDQFTKVISNFNEATNGRVELLFFQNCNKATVEVIYEARNCARYTLASQLNLGAPNYYYKGFLKHLNNPSVGGREAAIAIMDAERLDMYHTLTLVDNQAVKGIPEKLSKVLQTILVTPLPTVKQSEFPTHYYFGEQHCDLLLLLNYLSKVFGGGGSELVEFTHFLRSSVITHYKT
ncbi:MAG: clostripain-related cysteine peptidase, partial [Leptolyngbyaceae cyanobacterium bins.59]|nr:clostripain-related cysteine peptidase [Leptolyngbyaceae cyanobacterium bins.59]